MTLPEVVEEEGMEKRRPWERVGVKVQTLLPARQSFVCIQSPCWGYKGLSKITDVTYQEPFLLFSSHKRYQDF